MPALSSCIRALSPSESACLALFCIFSTTHNEFIDRGALVVSSEVVLEDAAIAFADIMRYECYLPLHYHFSLFYAIILPVDLLTKYY
mgnify:FL=1